MWIGGVEAAPDAASWRGRSNRQLPITLDREACAASRMAKVVVKANTPHRSPWRVLMIGRQPGRLIESEIIRNLSTPSELKDSSWVKPGMMAWDHWWTGDTVMDTATIKQYIQLAADMGWPYQLIDWGWYGESNKPEADITKVIDALDMEEVRRFAQEKDVRLWLWLHWTDVDRNDAYKTAFPLLQGVGHRRREDRLHGPRRSGDGPVVRKDHSRRGREPVDGELPRRVQNHRASIARFPTRSRAKACWATSTTSGAAASRRSTK